ncbi:MAG: TonB-dependent receptor [Bacteroidia bacterium]|nr:TonB-dependent receptor [Bacteroidia bacterium]
MSMRLSVKLFFMVFLSAGQASSQNYIPGWKISGRIRVEGVELAGFSVQLKEINKHTISSKEGAFTLEGTEQGSFTLRVHGLGCADWDSLLVLQPGAVHQLDIQLAENALDIPQVEIFSSRSEAMRMLPGAATLISAQQIGKIQPVSSNEVLRKAAGVHVVDEEGLGLRPNIGFRGLDPDRSRYVLVLEDGVPVSLSPYGEPEMYYSPSVDRMQQVEVLKGSSSIQYGPRTIAGVINYRTLDPPLKTSGSAQFTGGSGGYFSSHLSYGTSIGNTGVQVSYLRKQADDFGLLKLRMNDLVARFRWLLSAKAVFGLKAGIYDEQSNANYIGMTRAMYESGQYDDVRLAPEDGFHIRRYSLSATYNVNVTERLKLEALLFAYTTQRNWCRQDFTYNALDTAGNLLPKPADYSGVTWGDESLNGGAIYMRNSTGNRNRTFDVAGADLRLRYNFGFIGMKHELGAGLRFMAERAHEIRVNGSKPGALSGTISDEEFRPVQGYSAFITDKIKWGERWELNPGLRVEYMQFNREIVRGKYTVNGQPVTRDTSVENHSQLYAFIPGAGLSYQLNKELMLYSGVHRGFAPPRIKDAITSDGTDQELEAELSWNYELGLRAAFCQGIRLELTAFYLDFENQVIPLSESSGGSGAGLINGGSTRSRGAEGTLHLSSSAWSGNRWVAGLQLTATYTETEFNTDRFLGSTDNKVNIKGNHLPYAPQWQGNGLLSLESPFGVALSINLQYTGEQYTDVYNTVQAAPNGLNGMLDDFYSLDAGIQYHWQKGKTIFSCAVKNLSNERYVYTRRPQGIRVAQERMVFVGVKKNF